MSDEARRYRWFVVGDLNGFFGLMFDNLTVLSFLAGILVFAFGYPGRHRLHPDVPGHRVRRALRGPRLHLDGLPPRAQDRARRVTAMPLGLDTPSTIGIALVVLGPAFVSLKAHGDGGARGRDDDLVHRHGHHGHDRRSSSWSSPSRGLGAEDRAPGRAARLARGHRPRAHRLRCPWSTSSACRSSAWSLSACILYNLVARIRLPGNIPGVLAAVALGTALYHVLGPAGPARAAPTQAPVGGVPPRLPHARRSTS